MTVYYCNEDFESMMTCIYDAWASGLGHDQVELALQGTELKLFCEYRFVEPDSSKAEKVIRSIKRKISGHAFQMVVNGAMSSESDRLDVIYRFLILGFRMGGTVVNRLTEPCVSRLWEIGRKVANETHQYREFIRFRELENGVLLSQIEPKSNVLLMVAPHFADRMPGENWVIVDERRKAAAIHPAGGCFYLRNLSEEEVDSICRQEKTDEPYADLWKIFFQTTAVMQRKNERCQNNMLPKWYRKHMTEFIH